MIKKFLIATIMFASVVFANNPYGYTSSEETSAAAGVLSKTQEAQTSAPKESGIRGKILVWDLLTVAYSEGEYSSNEKRLLRFIAKCLGVDYAILLEMEHTVRTLLAIEAEENWLKNTDRSYAVVEERVNELTERKNTIMLGIRTLMVD